jgi:hypothetical protein
MSAGSLSCGFVPILFPAKSPMNDSPQALGLQPTFGFGDRLGCATPGHLAALRKAGGPIRGLFAQQSIREMQRTHREADQVMQDAVAALTAAGFDESWGSDADHLKTPADVDRMMAAGFTFFTIDPSDHVDQQADDYDPSKVEQLYETRDWVESYAGRSETLTDGTTLSFGLDDLKRAAVKYAAAVDHAVELGRYIQRSAEQAGRACEIELSVDETEQPTTLLEHFVIADQMRQQGVKLISLAPRFIGELEKGVDYLGDVQAFEASVRQHAAVAEHLGPYKLSLHSGSDKLSIYPAFARATAGRFHVKTAGTSYLEALRVAAHHDTPLFRDIITFSRSHYDTDKATYHVHATLDHTPPADRIDNDAELEQLYLERWSEVAAGKGFTQPGRQILHCTFGSVVNDPDLGPRLRECLEQHADAYADILEKHFVKHLEALTA